MNRLELVKSLNENNINLDESIIDQLISFKDDTIKTNELFNLTAIKDDEEFMEKMIFDSLIGLSYFDLNNKKCIDVGTGGGFPGMVLAIANKTNEYYLLDATKKKVDRLVNYAKENGINNVIGVNERSENYARKHNEEFDYAFARAVAPLNILLEIIMPLLKVNGEFIAYKGKRGLEEIEESKNALKKLNCKVSLSVLQTLPFSKEERYLIKIKKLSSTNKKYPRDYSEISKKPL